MVISDEGRRARWVEAETIHLKRMGPSFDEIADQITRVGRGQTQALIAMPEPIVFPPNYQITRQACIVAAHQFGQVGYGCEIDPGYLTVSLERLSILG